MEWIITQKRTLGLNLTNDGAREYSYNIIISSRKKDVVFAQTNDRISAFRELQNAKNHVREQMRANPKMHQKEVRLVESKRFGIQKGVAKGKTNIGWRDEHHSTIKASTIAKAKPKK